MGILLFIWRLSEFVFFSFVHGTRLIGRALKRLVLRRGPGFAELIGLYLTELFESLGATFVKVGQVMSSRPDLFPPAVTTPLKRLQDNVAPFDARKIPLLFERAFGKRIDDVFESFETEPISSASVAHVHRATLADGRVVAVKVRRPGLLRKVKYDLLVLKLFTKVLNILPDMHLVALPEMVDEFGQAIYRQLDFQLEARNNRRFRENFAQSPHVKIPALVDELCNESFLVMEFVEGLERLDELDLTAEERALAARVSLRSLYQMLFADGFVHADMHPGNVFFRKGGEFVLLDVGLVAELSEKDQRSFVDFFFGLVTNNGTLCAKTVYETAPYRKKTCKFEDFEKELTALISDYGQREAIDFEVSGFSAKLFDIQRRHGIRNTPSFATCTVSIIVFEGITKYLDPRMDFQAEGRTFFAEVMGMKAARAAEKRPA